MFHPFAVTRFLALLLLSVTPTVPCVFGQDTVRVFILAGQSNMVGKAQNKLLDYQATAPETQSLFAHLREGDQWIVRDDVLIRFGDRHGGLTIGYGSPNRTGMELEFGTQLGNHFQEPVLLIKTAWGGHSLYRKFRSPSAGMPSEERLKQELENAQKSVRKRNEKNNRDDPLPTLQGIAEVYGSSYRSMLGQVRDTEKNYATMFPTLKGKQLEIAGFVWFQGWNDQYNGAELEYASNMKHFIHDVREEFDEPNLPFVIAVMGQNGSKPAKNAMLTIQQAQLAMESLPEYQGNVKAVRTDVLIDKQAETLFPTWRDNVEQWERTGSDFPYHYLGSAIWFNRIGQATSAAMLELLKTQAAAK